MSFFKRSAPAEDLAHLKVTDARTGDVISISGAGDGFADLDFTADRTVRYQGGARRWFEVSGPYMERRVALRVSGDEEIETHLNGNAQKVALEDLGLSEQDLSEMDERQNTADSFEFDNKVWLYCLSREIQAYSDGQAAPTGSYYWEFREQGGKGLIAIRKPQGEPFAVTRYDGIPPADVTIYRGNI